MGLGLYLAAEFPKRLEPDALIRRALNWVNDHVPDAQPVRGVDLRERPTVYLNLHPAEENLELTGIGHGRLLASGKTSSAGPGYHAFVVDLLDRLARDLELVWLPRTPDADWADETGYFETRDFPRLQEEMLTWLRALARNLPDNEGSGFEVCMPMTHHFEVDAFCRTPLGPRDRAWFDSVAADPSRGIDFFPWWEQGTSAGYHLGVALALMWNEVRWHAPENESERMVLQRVLDSLERAFKLDPSRAFPWAEWDELLQISRRKGCVSEWVHKQASHARPDPRIGYRRHPVKVMLTGGWSIRIPGSFSEEWDDRGTFCGWGDGRTVWFTGFVLGNGADMTPDEMVGNGPDDEGERFERRDGALVSRAVLCRESDPDDTYWALKSDAAVPHRRAACTICFHDPSDRQWAMTTWQSLTHGSARSI
ncbi:MAG: hypothetical protein HY898_01445 [Deltaproteobacteria bacterium]|nr:hypothetical protein [Deltaproteobacteria bacterium]